MGTYYFSDYAYSWWWFVLWLFIYGVAGFLISLGLHWLNGATKYVLSGVTLFVVIVMMLLWLGTALLYGMVPW